MPWVNVIANPRFGTIVTASGSAHTWSENSRENRLTPFANDPVVDPTGEALFIRDDETGRRVVADAGPAAAARRRAASSSIRHAAGVTQLLARRRDGIRHELDVFVDADDPVKFSLLTLTNDGAAAADAERLRLQRLGARAAARRASTGTSSPSYDAARGAILARNAYNDEFAQPRRVRARQRAAALGDRRPPVVHRPQRLARRGRRRCADATLDRRVRRRPRSVRGAAGRAWRSQPGETPAARVPARPGHRRATHAER